MKKYADVEKINRRSCIVSLIIRILAVLIAFIGIAIELTSKFSFVKSDSRWKTLMLFTMLSNIAGMFSTLSCITYNIDGLRHKTYHEPRFMVKLSFCTAGYLSFTMLVSALVLAPTVGFYTVFIKEAGFFLHFAAPVLTIISFICINMSHEVPFKVTLYAMIPPTIYGIFYYIVVFVLKEDTHLNDFYRLDVYMPFSISILLLEIILFCILNLIRFLHNKRHFWYKEQVRLYYLHSDRFDCPCMEDAIAKLAHSLCESREPKSDIEVPLRLLLLLKERYHSDKSIPELCAVYTQAYYEKLNKESYMEGII